MPETHINQIGNGRLSDQEVYERIFDGLGYSGYPAYVLSDTGFFLYVNDAFARYTGNSKEKWLRMNTDYIRKTFQPSIREYVMEARHEVVMYQEITTAAKEYRRQLTVGIPVFGKDGETIRRVLVIIIPIGETVADAFNETYDSITDEALLREGSPVAHSAALRQLLSIARRAATTDCPCLISGETGTGKGVIAQYIHRCSMRKDRPLQTINCAALPESLIESELFGYEPGSFTGASKQGKRGAIEAASGGTLFLDEVNSLSAAAQSKLLRVLETHKIRRIGATDEIAVDFRLITASNVPLIELCRKGEFRFDLYFRLNLMFLPIPPLRERRADIIPLANAMLSDCCERYGQHKIFSPRFYEFLFSYDWPGNVRELRNVVEQSYLMSDPESGVLDMYAPFLPTEETGQHRETASAEEPSLSSYMDAVEEHLIRSFAAECKTSYELAEKLKINQSTAVRKLQKYHISLKEK